MQLPSFQEYIGEMAAPKDHQKRGICQLCGREQAVRDSGKLSHHGYTIQHGWFQGACPGSSYEPIQFSTAETQRWIKTIEGEIPGLEKQLKDFESGKLRTKMVPTGRRIREKFAAKSTLEMVSWDDGADHMRKTAIANVTNEIRNRIRDGKSTIKFLNDLMTQYHGKELKHIDKVLPGAKPKIEVGSTVRAAGQTVVVTKIETRECRGVGPALNGQHLPHVFWIDENGHENAYPMRNCRLVK